MILSKEDLLCDDQDITGTADSENIIELPKRSNFGQPLRILIQVTETFLTLTSLTIDVETDALAAFGSPTTIFTGTAIGVADLVAGYNFELSFMPRENEEFIRLEMTVGGSNATAGQITAGIIFDEQSNGTVSLPPA